MLPTDTLTDFEAAIGDDLEEIIAGDLGSDAVYFANGSGSGVALRVYVAAGVRGIKPSQRIGMQGGGERSRQAANVLMVPAAAPGVSGTGGVVDGRVIALKEGDAFIVRGRMLGMSDAEVRVRVVGEIRQIGTVWDAEVRA